MTYTGTGMIKIVEQSNFWKMKSIAGFRELVQGMIAGRAGRGIRSTAVLHGVPDLRL
jgi:hypothetical protein